MKMNIQLIAAAISALTLFSNAAHADTQKQTKKYAQVKSETMSASQSTSKSQSIFIQKSVLDPNGGSEMVEREGVSCQCGNKDNIVTVVCSSSTDCKACCAYLNRTPTDSNK